MVGWQRRSARQSFRRVTMTPRTLSPDRRTKSVATDAYRRILTEVKRLTPRRAILLLCALPEVWNDTISVSERSAESSAITRAWLEQLLRRQIQAGETGRPRRRRQSAARQTA